MNTASESSTLQPSAALRRSAWLAGAIVVALLAGAGLRVYASSAQARALADITARNAMRSVLTTSARAADAKRGLSLPGTLHGATEAAIYARVNGYLKSWNKDIGDPVRKGELLAVIDTPETEQELLQARAASEQIKARLALAETSLARWHDLRQRDAVSQQEFDERAAALRQSQADLAAANANIVRLEQLQSYRRIVAPLDGVVVRRNVEIGGLVNAGNNGNARALYQLAQLNPLRVSVAVPQSYAADVRAGQEVSLTLAEKPGAAFKGKIARTAGAVDPESRAMAVEIELPNPEGRLLPGSYVEVGLRLASDARALIVPASALQYRQDGPRLALVDADSRIVMRPVKLGRDLGRTVEVLSGIGAADRIVLNPHDALEPGETVIATAAPIPPAKAEPARSPASAAAVAEAGNVSGRS